MGDTPTLFALGASHLCGETRIFIICCSSLVFVKSSVCLLIVPVVLFCVSIAMFVKQYKVLGALSILSFLSCLMNVAVVSTIALGIFAIKKLLDIKRLNAQIQKKATEHDEKLEKQNALAKKNAELIKEIEVKQKKIDKIQKEIELIKNENDTIE